MTISFSSDAFKLQNSQIQMNIFSIFFDQHFAYAGRNLAQTGSDILLIKNRVRPAGRTLPKTTCDSNMYNRAFPVGNALLFFAGGVMSLLRLPCGKLPLAFLAVPAGKDGRVERPCQTVDDFIGVRGNVCGLFLFVQTHAPLIVPPWQSRARKSKFQFLSGARARKFSALHLLFGD